MGKWILDSAKFNFSVKGYLKEERKSQRVVILLWLLLKDCSKEMMKKCKNILRQVYPK